MVNRIFLCVRKVVVWLLVLPIRFYQLAISPYTPNSCRHVPSCSAYAIEALKTHGAIGGLVLAIRRIIRCHPWGTHGYDPVPEQGYKGFSRKNQAENIQSEKKVK